MIRRLGLAVLVASASASAALANDSTATIGAGGLELQKTDAIDMVSEYLFLSVDQVRVRYQFRNRTARPVTTVVAFPVPPRSLSDEYGGDVAFPSGFATLVDGKKVAVTQERKALVDGTDHSALLRSLEVPVAPDEINQATVAMDRLAQGDRQRLIRLKLAGEEEYDDDGKGMRKHLIPLWTVQDTYWWRQTFPVGHNVAVEHRYVPGAGGAVESAIAFPEFRHTADNQAMIRQYCIEPSLIREIDDRRAKGTDGPHISERNLRYILTTGANWAQPIGQFRLVIDKGRPGNLVSFCGDGVRKISPTQFEMRKTNFKPTRDLDVLILEPRRRPL